VQFYAIKYDSNSDTEQGPRRLIGQTRMSLDHRATAPAQIIWNTKGFGPAGGITSQDYRIYVDLNYDKKIVETYPPEDPNKVYAPGLAKGVDPGQNDEGFGLATVMKSAPSLGKPKPSFALATDLASAAAASSNNYGSPAVTFSSTPLAALATGSLTPLAAPATGKLAGQLVTSDVTVSFGLPVQLRAQVCSTANSRDPIDVVVFDGEPSSGKVIAWKRIYVPGNGQCESTWFKWTPTRGDHNLVATIGPAGLSSPQHASLQIHVP
jgi:hypothetical protein